MSALTFVLDHALVALIASLVLAGALGSPLIGLLRRMAYRQHAYEDAPETHQKKTGTPTMGGLLFVLAPLVALAVTLRTPAIHVVLAFAVLVIGSGAIGFADDYSAIRRGRNRGLRAREKFVLTAVVGLAFLIIVDGFAQAGMPLLFIGPIPTWLWYVLSLAVILATTHAVNLTDGLDGLASGTIVPPLAVLAYAAYRAVHDPAGSYTSANAVALLFAATTIGAVLGFFVWNRHPAKMFMGDTGSLALGGALAGIAILTGAQLLLLLIGGVFVAETLSVMIQVASYKTTKRRVFRMSPLHHHFELGGWPETKVTASFWAASLILSLIGAVIVGRA